MFYLNLNDINEHCRRDPAEFVGESEQNYTNMIENIADGICERCVGNQRMILLLNGPSSSGKTTTARRIRDAINQRGICSHSISMDDYYLTRGSYEMPRDENGDIDLESPLCMDLPMLSEHLAALCEGEIIEVPKYDFITRKRTIETEEVQLEKGEIAIIEGIHSLNSVITGKIQQHAIGVYMAVGTEVVIANEWRLAPHVLRFVRRAIRDKHFRDEPTSQTIAMWHSVRRGERLYIRPYISSATHIVNTYLSYEDCVLMQQLREDVKPYHKEMIEAGLEPLVRALDCFEPLTDLSLIPPHSIMHEFLG